MIYNNLNISNDHKNDDDSLTSAAYIASNTRHLCIIAPEHHSDSGA